MYSFLKVSVFLLFPLLAAAETYYEVRSANGETTLQPASAVGNLEHVPQQQVQQQQPQQIIGSQQSQAPAQASNGFRPFGSFSLEAPSFFGLGEASTLPLLAGVAFGVALVYLWQYIVSLFSGWGWGRKLLATKFGYEEEVAEEPEKGDLKKDLDKAVEKTDEAKSRRKRHALRLARTAGRIQRSIDDFEYKYRPEY